MSKRQDHILISYYEAKYAQKYGRRPLVNRHREKWGFQDMLESLPMEDCKRVIDYYLDLDVSHTVRGLLHKFDVYFENMNESEAEKAERIRLRNQTKDVVAEFRRKRQIEQSRDTGAISSSEEQ